MSARVKIFMFLNIKNEMFAGLKIVISRRAH